MFRKPVSVDLVRCDTDVGNNVNYSYTMQITSTRTIKGVY